MTSSELIRDSAARIRDRIARAAARAGRPPESVTLIAVSKKQPPERVREAREAGLTVFGENYVQEAQGKIPLAPDAEWHLIGRLQGNKVKKAVALFACIQAADSLKLLSEISRRGAEAGKTVPVLIEINLAGERSKAGVSPDELPGLVEAARGMPGILLKGLMAIPPIAGAAEESRPYFARLRELLAAVAPRGGPGPEMTELSMGMSHDFEVAIEEGATMVRIGTALFGSRTGRTG